MAATDTKFYIVELRSGSTLAPARNAHLKAVKAWCQADTHSKLRRTMLHDSLDYYAYTGKFTAAVMRQIKADTTVIDAVNEGQPVENADTTGSITNNSSSWWLTDIAPVPPAVLPHNVPANAVWYSPETQGEGVDVYVVDEGFGDLKKDSDFQGRNIEKLWPGMNEGEAEPFLDEAIKKDDQHGYYVARLAAGHLSSPAPKSNLCWISYLGQEINNAVSNIGVVEALSEVWMRIDSPTRQAVRTSVINCSWGVSLPHPERDILARLCQKIAEKVVFVAACGNQGKPMDKIQPVPAWLPETISVGCSERDADRAANFSNWGDRVDLYAPGTEIRLTDEKGYLTPVSKFEGTSFSAPLVTGAVACLLSGAKAANTSLKPSEVRELLLSRARTFTIQKPGEKPRRAKKLVVLPYP
ncbi:Peptidase S8/S53 domain-containing protein [Mycena venus]|uniref:Peptidase S8/S53 domain-containing protein n=1 Tax=Mycena venus TaxID=2733690 RepID=A0A8H6YC47_9AGAR|nr:Peptidase S8/S53 domain-containing protein [Mycena venus]